MMRTVLFLCTGNYYRSRFAALLAKFDGEFASHSSTYAGTGTVRYTW
jgi:protein-tyrosine-phosphatase